jgi:small subunit ribosomal protein S20
LANTKQAKKRVRQAEKHRRHNAAQRSMMRTFLKKTLAVIDAGNQEEAREQLRQTTSVLDRFADKGLIHKNKAARHKSRLSARVKQMAVAS